MTKPTLEEQIDEIVFKPVTLGLTEYTKAKDQLIALIQEQVRLGKIEELESLRNEAWDNSGDGSKLGEAYDTVIVERLAQLQAEEKE